MGGETSIKNALGPLDPAIGLVCPVQDIRETSRNRWEKPINLHDVNPVPHFQVANTTSQQLLGEQILEEGADCESTPRECLTDAHVNSPDKRPGGVGTTDAP